MRPRRAHTRAIPAWKLVYRDELRRLLGLLAVLA